MKAVLFCFSFRPFKIITEVPNITDISIDIARQCHSFDLNTSGKFKYLKTLGDYAIYVFAFDEAKGCRAYHQDFHGMLPPCKDELQTMQDMPALAQSSKVGESFYYGNDAPHRVSYETGGFNFFYPYGHSSVSDHAHDEELRLSRLDTALNDQLRGTPLMIGPKGVCKPTFSGNPTPFKGGGGDRVLMRRDFLEGTVLLTVPGVNESYEESPLYDDEVRLLANFEGKDTTSQTADEIEHQLKANMYLHSVELFIKKLQLFETNNRRAAEDIVNMQTLSAYGISFGMNMPTNILKLKITLDGLIEYTKRFRSGTYAQDQQLDWAINYVMVRMKANSSLPTPPMSGGASPASER